MSAFTYAELKTRLESYVAAEQAILSGAQEYQVGQGQTARRLRRADLAEIRAEIASLQAQIAAAPDNPARPRRRGVFYLRPF